MRYPEDIEIKVTGLRPGEKLYEELLASGENTLPTYHKKIMISKLRDLDYADVRSKIDELCVSNMFFNADTVRLMKKIVPEFVSNNSEFCKLDKKEEFRLKTMINFLMLTIKKKRKFCNHKFSLYLSIKTIIMMLKVFNRFAYCFFLEQHFLLSCGASKEEVVYFQDISNFETQVNTNIVITKFKVDDLVGISCFFLKSGSKCSF